MKTLLAWLGCLLLAGQIAGAQVNCATAPYGESISRYGRDEFDLGIIAVKHNDNHRALPRALIREIHRQMRAACRAKFESRDLARYARLGLGRSALRTESVGAIAALAIDWQPPYRQRTRLAAAAPPTPLRSARAPRHARRAASADLTTVTATFPACPRKSDIMRLLSAALIDKADWPHALARGKRRGCIELYAGERLHVLRQDVWTDLAHVRPERHARTYWTDLLALK
jgi:hypothetical protein